MFNGELKVQANDPSYIKKLEKKQSCGYIFQNWSSYIPTCTSKYKTSTLSKFTEAWQYSNIVYISEQVGFLTEFQLTI